MNNELIKQGFIKRAAEYNISKRDAEFLLKEATLGTSLGLGAAAGALGGTALMGPGALVGGGLGALSGLMDGTRDSRGETHRLRNALSNGGIGAGLGAAGGYLTGGLAAGIPTFNAAQQLSDTFHLNPALFSNQPYADPNLQGISDFFKGK